MARSSSHAYPTAIIAVGYVLKEGAPETFWSKKVLVLLLIWFLGQMMDYFDHISVARIKKLLEGDNKPIEGHINWMHTWIAFGIVTVLLCCFGFWGGFGCFLFPMIAYAIHIIMDGAVNGPFGNSPTSKDIYETFFAKGKIFHGFFYKSKLLKP